MKNNSVSLKATKKYRKKMYKNTKESETKTDHYYQSYESGKPEVYDTSIAKFINACRLNLATENEW